MDRLTNRDGAGNAFAILVDRQIIIGWQAERLAAYEDTGLEPEDVTDLMAAHGTAIGALAKYRALGSVEELSALVKARKASGSSER